MNHIHHGSHKAFVPYLQRRFEGATPNGDGGLFAFFFPFVFGSNILVLSKIRFLVPVAWVIFKFGDVLVVLPVLVAGGEGCLFLRPIGPNAHS
jgi:hypothetical protein